MNRRQRIVAAVGATIAGVLAFVGIKRRRKEQAAPETVAKEEAAKAKEHASAAVTHAKAAGEKAGEYAREEIEERK